MCQCQTLVLVIPGSQWSIVRKTYRTDYDYSCMMLRKYHWMLSYSHFFCSLSNCSKIKLIFFYRIFSSLNLFFTLLYFLHCKIHYLLFYRTYKSYLSYHEVDFRLNWGFIFSFFQILVKSCEACSKMFDADGKVNLPEPKIDPEKMNPKIVDLQQQVRELELELAQTKLALVESECKTQDLTHSLHAAVSEIQASKNTWFTKTLNSIKEVANTHTGKKEPKDWTGHTNSIFIVQSSLWYILFHYWLLYVVLCNRLLSKAMS